MMVDTGYSTQRGGSICDHQMLYKLGHKTFWAGNADSLIGAAGVSANNSGLGQQACLNATFNLTGMSMDTGDWAAWLLSPMGNMYNVDFNFSLSGRVYFMSSGGDDAQVKWIVGIKQFAEGDALTAAPTASMTASMTYDYDTSTINGSDVLNCTPVRSLNSAGLLLATKDLMVLTCELDDRGDAVADEIKLIGVQLIHTQSLCNEDGKQTT